MQTDNTTIRNGHVIDLSPFIGYRRQLIIRNWDAGFSWSTVSEQDYYYATHLDPLGFPLRIMIQQGYLAEWYMQLPLWWRQNILQLEQQFPEEIATMLWICSRFPQAQEILEEMPRLLWLIAARAKQLHWSEEVIQQVLLQPQHILAYCDLPANDTTLQLLQQLPLQRLVSSDLALLQQLLQYRNTLRKRYTTPTLRQQMHHAIRDARTQLPTTPQLAMAL